MRRDLYEKETSMKKKIVFACSLMRQLERVLLPIKRGLSERCQCHSTYNWYKGRNYPKSRPLCAPYGQKNQIILYID